MPRQIRQLPKLFGFLVSQFGLMQLVGTLFLRAREVFPVAWRCWPQAQLPGRPLVSPWHGTPVRTQTSSVYPLPRRSRRNTINAIEVGNQTTATVTNLSGAQQISFCGRL